MTPNDRLPKNGKHPSRLSPYLETAFAISVPCVIPQTEITVRNHFYIRLFHENFKLLSSGNLSEGRLSRERKDVSRRETFPRLRGEAKLRESRGKSFFSGVKKKNASEQNKWVTKRSDTFCLWPKGCCCPSCRSARGDVPLPPELSHGAHKNALSNPVSFITSYLFRAKFLL